MAALAIPAIAAAVAAIAPEIPGVVQLVENLFGHSAQTGAKAGPAKLQTAVGLLQQVLTALANAGKVPAAVATDPALAAGVTGAVQQVVNTMQAAGQLGAPGAAAAKPAATAAQAGAPAGMKIVITGLMQSG